jgi:hypothetical protein
MLLILSTSNNGAPAARLYMIGPAGASIRSRCQIEEQASQQEMHSM